MMTTVPIRITSEPESLVPGAPHVAKWTLSGADGSLLWWPRVGESVVKVDHARHGQVAGRMVGAVTKVYTDPDAGAFAVEIETIKPAETPDHDPQN
jgi:hypothetical protein